MNDALPSWSGKGEAEDQALIARAVRREAAAWTQIYERFSGALLGFFIHRVGNRETAEDLTAQVFLEALRGATGFSGTLADLRSWLFQIGRNNLIDYARHRRRPPVGPLEEATEAEFARAHPGADPAETLIADLDRRRLLEAMESLSSEQREVILLRLSGGLTATQIAGIVSRTPGAVKALQHRAMLSLALRLRPTAEPGPPGGPAHPGAEEALDQVLDALGSGDSAQAERLMAAQPELGLDRLVQAAGEIEGWLLVAPVPEARERHVRLLTQEAIRLGTSPAPAPRERARPGAGRAAPRRSRRPSRRFIALTTLVALALLAVPAGAALASNAQPGQPLFGTRLLLERVELSVQPDPAKKVALRLKFVTTRMGELGRLVPRGDTQHTREIAIRFTAEQRGLRAAYLDVRARGKLPAGFTTRLAGTLRASAERLTTLLGMAGCPAHPGTPACRALAGAQAGTRDFLRVVDPGVTA